MYSYVDVVYVKLLTIKMARKVVGARESERRQTKPRGHTNADPCIFHKQDGYEMNSDGKEE